MNVRLLYLLLGPICSPLTAMVLDSNTIKNSAEVQSSKQGFSCLVDEDCGTGKFCHSSGEEEPVCATCRRVRRRCQRNAMCCSGAVCINDVCTAVEEGTPIDEGRNEEQEKTGLRGTGQQRIHENKPKKKPSDKQSTPGKGGEGHSCLRTSDCSLGLCCARHFWTKICKPVLIEGQVCTKRGRKDAPQGPEIFQRCDCGPGLTCRTQASGTSSRSQRSKLKTCQRN
ncbi:dickkopf-related protein 4 [Protopterus annectens]|uniref:dickkopf-related protein 4 n=1 Tax=Protopterus annectens TaxID=7888 RepID=UPI001CF9DF01|nr:dickkopf-related protein 4 [Protopterus annectens]